MIQIVNTLVTKQKISRNYDSINNRVYCMQFQAEILNTTGSRFLEETPWNSMDVASLNGLQTRSFEINYKSSSRLRLNDFSHLTLPNVAQKALGNSMLRYLSRWTRKRAVLLSNRLNRQKVFKLKELY